MFELYGVLHCDIPRFGPCIEHIPDCIDDVVLHTFATEFVKCESLKQRYDDIHAIRAAFRFLSLMRNVIPDDLGAPLFLTAAHEAPDLGAGFIAIGIVVVGLHLLEINVGADPV